MSASCPVLGFTVRIAARKDVPAEAVRRLSDELVVFLDADGLAVQGFANTGFFIRREGSQTTEMDRQLVGTWAVSRADIATVDISDLHE